MSEDGIEATVRSALTALGVEAELMPCDPDFADTAAFCEHYGVAPEESANTILVAATRGDRAFVACLALATTRLDVNGKVREVTGFRKASFAGADDTVQLTGMMVGGVTPFGLPDSLRILIDSAVMNQPSVVIGGGSRSLKLRLDPQLLLRIPTARVIENLAKPAPAA
jgi:prolyl-tRNA editing enzyme YbaK/EbsC (Cys-tRNA(Pro) deacylase)